jgi:hypothetical protein
MDDDLSFPLAIFATIILGITFALGYNVGSQNAERDTIKYCIEQQAKCKIKYDFIKLGETK